MTPLRALSIGCALVATRRWPAFAAVAGILAGEEAAGDAAAHLANATASSLAWGASTAATSAVALVHAARPWSVAGLLAFAHMGASAALASAPSAHALTTAATCAFASTILLTRTAPHDLGRLSLLALLGGNVAGSLFAAAVGMHESYSAGLVLWSNNITHASILGLALWTMRAR